MADPAGRRRAVTDMYTCQCILIWPRSCRGRAVVGMAGLRGAQSSGAMQKQAQKGGGSRLDRLSHQLSTTATPSRSFPVFNCLGACNCAAANGRAGVLGPLLAPAEFAGASTESVHGILHTLQAEQNKNSTFSATNTPGVAIKSGEVFEVQCLCASGGWVTRDGTPSPGAVATTRSHAERPTGALRDPNGVAEENFYKESQGVGGNPICEPVYVVGAEVGDTLQVEVLKLKTADFGWTCVRPGGITLEAPTRETLGFDPIYDDPEAPEDGIDAARVFIWDLHPETREDCELTTHSGRKLTVPYAPFCGAILSRTVCPVFPLTRIRSVVDELSWNVQV
jgi:hypothetical protein